MLLVINTFEFLNDENFRKDFGHDNFIKIFSSITDINCIISLLNKNYNDVINEDIIQKFGKIPLNFEVTLSEEHQRYVLKHKPHACYIVPKTRHENSVSGLNVAGQMVKIISFIGPLFLLGINPVLFISPEFEQIEAAANTGVKFIELNSFSFANSFGTENEKKEFEKLKRASEFAQKLNLKVILGHGLNYNNIKKLSQIAGIYALDIGNAVITRAKTSGFETAISEIKALMC